MNPVKLSLLFTLSAGLLCAQSPAPATLTLSAAGPVVPLSVYPGQTVDLQISLAGSSGWNISGIGFSAWAAVQNLAAGTAATAAQKTLWTGGTAGPLLVGWTAASGTTAQAASDVPFADGQILTFAFVVPITQAIGSTVGIAIPSPVLAVDINGGAVAVNVGAPMTLPVVVNPVCVKTANTDVQAFLSTPTAALLGQLVIYLASIVGGTCH